MDEVLSSRRERPAGVTCVLVQAIDLEPYRAAIEAGQRPRHALIDLADRTGGRVLTRLGAAPGRVDRLLGCLLGGPESWWLARRAVACAGGGHIQTNNEVIGLAVLALRGFRRRSSARIGFWVMNPNGARVRWWLRVVRLLRLQPLLLAENEAKIEQIRRHAGRRARVVMIDSPIDLEFFSPDPDPDPDSARPGRPTSARPLVVSAGLEKRDYRTLAAAVDGLDVDVEICALSPDATNTSAVMPDALPPNVAFVDLTIEGLRDLYRRADLVVIPTVPNDIDVGGSTMVEALACGRPVVASARGMYLDLARAGLLHVAEAGSAHSLRQVIREAVSQPEKQAEMGRRARAVLLADHGPQAYLDRLIDEIRRGGGDLPGLPPSPAGPDQPSTGRTAAPTTDDPDGRPRHRGRPADR